LKSINEVNEFSGFNLLLAHMVSHVRLEDAEVLIPLLHRLTSSTDLPLMLVGGKPVGSMDVIRELNESGELQKLITNAGAVIDGSKKKKGH
jgi:glutaredoxin-related protein